MNERTVGLLQRNLGALDDQLGVLKVSARGLTTHEALISLILIGQHVSELKRAVLRDMLFQWGATWLNEEELDDVMNTIESVVERVRLEMHSCSRLEAPEMTKAREDLLTIVSRSC